MLRFYPLLFICFLISTHCAANVVFVQNRGQWPAGVLFRADIPGGYLFLKQNSLHYVFYDSKAVADHHAKGVPVSDTIRAHGVAVELLGSQSVNMPEGRHKTGPTLNYFLSKNPDQWVGDAPAFGEVIYSSIYPGIDLRIYAYYQTLKYEFIVQPGADPSVIRLAYKGANSIRLSDSRLIVDTSVQSFSENKPYSYVSRDGRATEVAAAWQLSGNVAQFSLPNGYDRTQQLTLDPELVFSSYSGSVSDNWGHTATYDKEGNLYSAGSVFGGNFPVTTGAFQVSFGGTVDVSVMKFSPDGSRLLYATLLGGRAADLPHSLIVNNQGDLVMMGTTSSPDFPVTAGAFQTKTQLGTPFSASFTTTTSVVFANGSDLFVSILSPDGKQLKASTFVGGTRKDGIGARRSSDTEADGIFMRNYGDDLRGEVIVGPDDDVYVASLTESYDFPVPRSLPDGTSSLSEAVVFRLSADLSQLRWGNRISGSQGATKAYGLRLTPSGSLYVCGVTTSPDLPASPDAYQARPIQVSQFLANGFVARFDNQRLTRLTYLGTDREDAAYLIDVGPDGSPHVFGLTQGRYPVTTGTYQNAGSGQFIHAFDPDLKTTRFSTVIGSTRSGPDISPTALLVNECGNIYVSGWGGAVNNRNGYNSASNTNGLPVTSDAYQRTTNGSNFYIAILEQGAKSLLYATFMGGLTNTRGDHVDGGTSRFSPQGIIYQAVCACDGTSFPATATAWSRTNRSNNCNNLAFKFDIDKLKANFDTYQGSQKGVVTGCTPLALSFQNTSIGGRRYEWLVDGKVVSSDTGRVNYTFDKAGKYTVTLRAYNPLTCLRVDSVKQVVTVSAANFQVSRDTSICPNATVTLRASGATKYAWAPADGLSSTTIASPVAAPKQTTTYTVDMTNEFGCTARRSITVQTDASFQPSFSVQTNGDCQQPTRLTFTNNTRNADRYVWVMGNGDTVRTNVPENYDFGKSGQYQVTLIAYRNGCALSTSLPVSYEDLKNVPNVITPNGDGKNDVFNIGFTGAKLEIFNRWGRRIYQDDDYANNWGKDVPNGLYYYLITTPNGTQCKGWLQVIE